MLSVMFTIILTYSTCHEKKQILDHVIHDVLIVVKLRFYMLVKAYRNSKKLIVVKLRFYMLVKFSTCMLIKLIS